MENQVFNIKSGFTQSLVLKNNEIWLCLDKIKNIEKFEKIVLDKGMLSIGRTISFSSINEVYFNDSSKTITIKYLNEKRSEKKFKARFKNKSISTKFGYYLGEKLELVKTVSQEKKTKPLLINLLYLLGAIGGTFFLTSLEDTKTLIDNGSAKSRGRGLLLNIIVDYIGHTGVYIIGGLLSLYIVYDLVKRYKNPASDVEFKRVSF